MVRNDDGNDNDKLNDNDNANVRFVPTKGKHRSVTKSHASFVHDEFDVFGSVSFSCLIQYLLFVPYYFRSRYS